MSRIPPPRTPEQRQEALDEALRVRRERAKLKQKVSKSPTMVLELLDVGHRGTGDKIAGGLRIGDLLEAVDGIGPKLSAKMLESAGVDDASLRLDRLTNKEVAGIKEAFHSWLDG
jgi:hypothetical protein